VRRTIVTSALVAYLLVLLDLTLRRFPQPGAPANLLPLGTIAHYLDVGGWEMVKNLGGNVAAFVPLGLLLPAWNRAFRSTGLVTAFALAVSVLIELLQYLSGQRIADVDDVLLNTLGGWIGYLAFTASTLCDTRCGRTRSAPARS
jgi:glycopeptide antibiotics resistance protein